MARVGLISDTHGLLRPEALAALRGVDRILHAGDIGAADLLEQLQALAPVIAVRGNNDTEPWARHLPLSASVAVEGRTLLLIHELADLSFQPESRGIAAVIYGHSHRPAVEQRGAVLFVNPGSAGPRRFSLPVSVATLQVTSSVVQATIHELAVTAAKRPRRSR